MREFQSMSEWNYWCYAPITYVRTAQDKLASYDLRYIKSYHNKDNNMIETYTRKIKKSYDTETKEQLKALIKEESKIKRKRKTLIKEYNEK